MKVVIAIDSFKGSLTSLEAGKAAAEGVGLAHPGAETVVFPVADGGEGTVEALIAGLGGEKQQVQVCGPLGEKVSCTYGKAGTVAVMEMSAAAGITLVADGERNPMHTTTYGVGEMIAHGIEKGCREFVIGIGGSATNDCGIGMLQALGFEILDKERKPVPFGAEGVAKAAYICTEKALPQLKDCVFRIACDVENPLYGPQGCSAVYGPQKGATPKMVKEMDESIAAFARLVKMAFPDANPDLPGAGAAGGLGFAFLTFLGGKLEKGISLVLSVLGVEKEIQNADYVITGEGRIDAQTVMGKAPSGVARLAAKYNVPVLAFAGGVTKEARVCNENGILAYFPTIQMPCTLQEAMKPSVAQENMRRTVEQVFRLLK